MTDPLAALPSPGERRLAVRVTKDALRQIRGGHPWVYDGSTTSTSHEGAPGDLAVVFDDDREFAAIGLWEPTSPIRLRILHAGRPRQIDAEFWHQEIAAAATRRDSLAHDPATNAYRVVHGENDGLPGLVVDRYDDVAVVKLYSRAWFAHLRPVLDAVTELLAPTSVVLRLARNVAAGETHGLHDGDAIAGDAPREPVMFRENGLTFECSPTAGQKTGHFLDQRDNRARVRDLASGARVLDLFSCTGGFTVHAAAGGARSVHSVDQSPHAIEAVARNLVHNSLTGDHRSTVGDAFDVMTDRRDRGEEFDMVIIDPPSFAQRQANVSAALNAYRRLTRLGVALTTPGGTLVQASCSSRVDADSFFDVVHSSAAEVGATLDEFDRTGHPLDHPVGFAEGGYLKALYARVDR